VGLGRGWGGDSTFEFGRNIIIEDILGGTVMKRVVSTLLSLAVVISLAGCSSKGEETTKSTTKASETETEASETSDSETEKTEETEETTTAEETEETSASDTEGTTKGSGSGASGLSDYSISPDFAIRNDLKKVDYSITQKYRAYGFVPAGEDNNVYRLIKELDILTVKDDDTYGQLWNTLDGIYPALDTEFDRVFDEKLPSYVDGSAVNSLTEISDTYMVRADSEVFSFVLYQSSIDPNGIYSANYKTYNYRTGDSMEYNLNDIVSDRSAFANFFAEYLDGALKDNTGKMQEVEYLAGLISDPNAEVPFLLTYDGVIFVYNLDYRFDMFKIPAVYAGDYFDMSLFGATPESFALMSDEYDHIIWDIDGDGKMDNISALAKKDANDALTEFGISLNGNLELVPESELHYAYMGFSEFYLLKTDDGFYVYAELFAESSDAVVAVFKYDGSSFKFQKSFFGNMPMIGIDGFFYDPANFTVYHSSDIMGTGYVIDSVSAMGNDGMPKKTVNVGSRYVVLVTKQEITVDKFNSNGAADGTATLPANTVFAVLGIDTDAGVVLCECLNADESQNFTFQLKVDPAQGTDDWTIRFNGVDQQELFIGMRFAG